MPQLIDGATARQIVAGGESLLDEIGPYLRLIPGGAGEVAPMAFPGASLVLAGLLASSPWWGFWTDPRAEEAAGRTLNTVSHLTRPATDADALRQALALNTGDVRSLVQWARPQADAPPDTRIFPSPSAIQIQQPRPVADAVAREAVWQRAHHGLVHVPLAAAQGAADGASAAQGAATAQALASTVRAMRGVVTVLLPEAVTELVERIAQLKAAQQQANAEIRRDLEHQTERLTQRIGDLVRWLRTEALPDLERELRLQGRELRQAVRGVSVDLAEEADIRGGADASIMSDLAPLLALWPAVSHATQKVTRNEGLIDELEHLDWSSLLAFTAAPALVALITRLMPPVLSEGPSALAALEGAAASALGSL